MIFTILEIVQLRGVLNVVRFFQNTKYSQGQFIEFPQISIVGRHTAQAVRRRKLLQKGIRPLSG